MFKDLFTISGRWGRLNRLRYFLFSLLVSLPIFIILALFAVVNTISQLSYSFEITDTANASSYKMSDGELSGGVSSNSTTGWFNTNSEIDTFKTIADFTLSILGILAIIIYIWGNTCLIIKRFHDIDQSGWFSLLYIIPYINFGVLVCLLFFPGTKGTNRFGVDPILAGDNI